MVFISMSVIRVLEGKDIHAVGFFYFRSWMCLLIMLLNLCNLLHRFEFIPCIWRL